MSAIPGGPAVCPEPGARSSERIVSRIASAFFSSALTRSSESAITCYCSASVLVNAETFTECFKSRKCGRDIARAHERRPDDKSRNPCGKEFWDSEERHRAIDLERHRGVLAAKTPDLLHYPLIKGLALFANRRNTHELHVVDLFDASPVGGSVGPDTEGKPEGEEARGEPRFMAVASFEIGNDCGD